MKNLFALCSLILLSGCSQAENNTPLEQSAPKAPIETMQNNEAQNNETLDQSSNAQLTLLLGDTDIKSYSLNNAQLSLSLSDNAALELFNMTSNNSGKPLSIIWRDYPIINARISAAIASGQVVTSAPSEPLITELEILFSTQTPTATPPN